MLLLFYDHLLTEIWHLPLSPFNGHLDCFPHTFLLKSDQQIDVAFACIFSVFDNGIILDNIDEDS